MVRLTGESADGWLPLRYTPEHVEQAQGWLAEGAARSATRPRRNDPEKDTIYPPN